jgi:spore maturation protein CgeB
MNILFLDWECFGKVDAVFTLKQMGHCLTMFFHKDYQSSRSPAFLCSLDRVLSEESFDLMFSFNYYPLVAESCHSHQLPYISIVYDSPFVNLYSNTIFYPTNYVFLFDRQQYFDLERLGVHTVYYMPLPVHGSIIDTLLKKPYDKERVSAEVSFVGALYNEQHNLFEQFAKLDSYTLGYLHGIMEAQLHIYGCSLIESLLTPPILANLQKTCPLDDTHRGMETPQYLYANYTICRKLTQLERIRLLTAAAAYYPVKLFTLNPDFAIPGVQNMGIADYYAEMPYVFYHSKINLNITLRSIQRGIPLRAMDILAAGGFLLTNYQEDFLEHFIPGEDFVYFTSQTDMLEKIDYYLKHEEERRQIAYNGNQKVRRNHNYEQCFRKIFAVVFG